MTTEYFVLAVYAWNVEYAGDTRERVLAFEYDPNAVAQR
jgi:hypothetical protein